MTEQGMVWQALPPPGLRSAGDLVAGQAPRHAPGPVSGPGAWKDAGAAARPIPAWFRRQFVDKRTKRLSPSFFFNRRGQPRKPFRDALRDHARLGADGLSQAHISAFFAFTPFKVGIKPWPVTLEDDDQAFERMVAWLAENAREPWLYWLDVIAFHSEADAALFRLFHF